MTLQKKRLEVAVADEINSEHGEIEGGVKRTLKEVSSWWSDKRGPS